jgi:hypothetical protein
MTTHRNKAARQQETREERRQRLADPASNVVEEQRQKQADNLTLQINVTAARKQEFENRKRELDADIIGLQRMRDRAARGYAEAARAGYDRIYSRVLRLAQVIADEFDHEVPVPQYDPPTDGRTVQMISVKPRSVQGQAADRSYVETGGKGKSGKGLPLKGPGSQIDPDWIGK